MKVTKRVPLVDSLGPPFSGNQKVRGDSLRYDQTMHAASGKHAAYIKVRFCGRGRTCCSGITTFSAYPPSPRKAHTWIKQKSEKQNLKES